MRWTSLFVVLTLLLAVNVHAQTLSKEKETTAKKKTKKKKRSKRKSPKIKAGQGLELRYGSPSWNKDATKIDSAKMIIRDRTSGKLAQIRVEESAPDSAEFNGSFNVNWDKNKSITPEVYVPPKNLRNDPKWISKMKGLIESKKLRRKPFIIKKDQKALEVFDTQTQAREAMQAYKAELSAKKAIQLKKKATDKKPIAAEALIETAKMAAIEEKKNKLALEAAKRVAKRLRLAQIERKRQADLLRKQKALAKAEKRRRKKERLKS